MNRHTRQGAGRVKRWELGEMLPPPRGFLDRARGSCRCPAYFTLVPSPSLETRLSVAVCEGAFSGVKLITLFLITGSPGFKCPFLGTPA